MLSAIVPDIFRECVIRVSLGMLKGLPNYQLKLDNKQFHSKDPCQCQHVRTVNLHSSKAIIKIHPLLLEIVSIKSHVNYVWFVKNMVCNLILFTLVV